jgi:hypothetical protein
MALPLPRITKKNSLNKVEAINNFGKVIKKDKN